MSIMTRLKKIESELTKSGNTVFRLVGCNGYYPEQEEDRLGKKLVVKIMVEEFAKS